mgnify:FL=1|jgi:diadenosine tetraphosphate (Ap4A) HIT family hydrolase
MAPLRTIGAHHLDHAEKLTDLPDEQMADILPTCRKLAKATVRFRP